MVQPVRRAVPGAEVIVVRPKRLLLSALIASFAILLAAAPDVYAAPKYKILHAFGNGQDGAGTWGSLLLDSKGNLYGTTSGGGLYTYGTVFELIPKSSGKWSEHILYSFENNGSDGCVSTAGLIFDTSGNLYGTSQDCGEYGAGAVFELTPGSGGWTQSVLYSFGSHQNDAFNPYAGVAIDRSGNLYGTGHSVYEVARGSGGWMETVIDDFSRHNDGSGPFAGLILDAKGNLYGTTAGGGTQHLGTVYELLPKAGGIWKERILHTFVNHRKDGYLPGSGALAIDGSGALYGTTVSGGCCDGTVYRLAQQANGTWKETILYDFQQGATGYGPGGGVARDKAGNLYGTTIYGGSPQCGCGVVYKLSPTKNGKWKYTVLHTFLGSDGAQPDANLILDDKGHLYGTAATAGPYGAGVVFEVTP